MDLLKENFENIYVKSFETFGRRQRPANVQKRAKRLQGMQGRILVAQKATQLSDIGSLIFKIYGDLQILSKNDSRTLRRELEKTVRLLADKELEFLQESGVSSRDINEYLEYLERPENLNVPSRHGSVLEKYDHFQKKDLTGKIREVVQTDPTAEFPETRAMVRHFHLHIGPTNSGKTYQAIQALKEAKQGAYLSPLRLLALEVYDTLNDAGVPTSLKTGEEHINTPEERVVSQTVETLDFDPVYDIVVIDECQMIADPERGHAWSSAIHGVKAEHVYLLASDNVAPLLSAIIDACGDTYDITRHERKTPLEVEDTAFDLREGANIREQIREGDCFILFSKRKVLDLAAHLEMAGIRASVIYGKLPPETRKAEVARFVSGDTKVVVSTDAIGMGVNLPIRRIIFAEGNKFDGRDVRPLVASEILQIAGRAGRFGKYDTGLVTTTIPKFLPVLAETLHQQLPEVTEAVLGFPRVLTGMDAELDAVMDAWHSIPAKAPYVKMSVERMQYLYNVLKNRSENFERVYGGDDKDVLYDMVSCPIDDGDKYVVDCWVYYCLTYAADVSLQPPKMPPCINELERLETYYKLLELYHMFSLHMGKNMDEAWLMKEKAKTEKSIETYLMTKKKSFVRKCKICSRPLPMGSRFGVCKKCYGSYY